MADKVKPDELIPGDVFQYRNQFWLVWQTPYREYAEWDANGPITKSRFWECPVTLVEIHGNRVVATHGGPLIGIRWEHRLIKRDDLRKRIYMQPYNRAAINKLRKKAVEARIQS